MNIICFRQEQRGKNILLRRHPQETRIIDVLVWKKRKVQLMYIFLTLLGVALLVSYQATTDDIGFSSSVLTIRKDKDNHHYQQQQQQQQQQHPLLFHFIHTTNQDSFHRRSLRAVESVLFHHPNSTVIIHVPDDGQTIALTSDMTTKPFLPLIQAGYKITVHKFQLMPLIEDAITLSEGSSNKVDRGLAEKWMKNKIMPNMMKWNWYVDISDLVRLLVVYTQGGLYMDTDVIVVNRLDRLPNSVGFVKPSRLGSGVLKFNRGNPFLADCINEYFKSYRSNTHAWGFVGPKLLKRIWLSKYQSCEIPNPPGPNLAATSFSSSIISGSGSGSGSNSQQQQQIISNDVDPSCPFYVLWEDVYYPNVDNCFVQTPNTIKKQQHIKHNTFIAHTYNQRTKWALENLNITKMKSENTLCNWLYNSFCIFCDQDVWGEQSQIKVVI